MGISRAYHRTSSMIFSSSLIRFSEVLDLDRSVLISVSSGSTTDRSMSALSLAFRMSSSRLSFSWVRLCWLCEDVTTPEDEADGDRLTSCRGDDECACWWCPWWPNIGGVRISPPPPPPVADWSATLYWYTCFLYSFSCLFTCSFSFRIVFRSACRASFI